LASSRLTDDGRVIITTPATWCDLGHVLYVIGSSASCAIPPADWAVRLFSGHPSNGGKPYGEGVDVARAELALAIGLGLVHPALAEEPAEPTSRADAVPRPR
jgi:hypothetical protein